MGKRKPEDADESKPKRVRTRSMDLKEPLEGPLKSSKKKKDKKSKKEKKEKKEKTVASEPSKKKDKKDKKDKKGKKDKKDKKDTKQETKAGKQETNTSEDSAAAAYRKTEGIAFGNATTIIPDPILSFDALPFSKTVIKALHDLYPGPTPIQAQGWPLAMAGDDLVAVAKTGSGKTLAFVLPALQMIQSKLNAGGGKPAGPQALVLAPTRELTMQIKLEVDKFMPHFSTEIICACIYGGVPKPPQRKVLNQGPQIVVATPGRLVDMMGEKAVSLAGVTFLILDEADRMLDMGFEPQITKIIAATAQEDRQTLCFTATWPKSVKKMAARYLRKLKETEDEKGLIHLIIGDQGDELTANKAITQKFYALDDSEKDRALWKILDELPDDAKMVTFANTKRRIDHLASACWGEGYGASAIHGGKSQQERDEALQQFATGKWPLMFATDVAARGLDIKGVTHVLNFDMPRDVENYVHRIGRTGRAGKSGASITFWNKDYDVACAPALAKIAREAGQEVPEWLEKWASKAGRQKQDKNWKM